MSWTSHNSLKLARLLKTTSPNTTLARCSLPARRHSSALIDVLKGATAASSKTSGGFESTIPRGWNGELGAADRNRTPVASMWDSVINHLEQARNTAREQVFRHSNDPPEVAWRRRSEEANIELRNAGNDGYGPRASATYAARKVKGAAANDTVGLNEAEVPIVSSGRTVTSGDFGRAVLRLNQILGKNRVRQEWRRDKYFTKPFQLRYELRSRRHRQRFAAEIRRKVQIVQAIKRRGM